MPDWNRDGGPHYPSSYECLVRRLETPGNTHKYRNGTANKSTLEVCATIGPFIRPEGGGHRPRCDGMSVKGWSFTSSMACS